jgi:hypothetical protein
MTSGLPPFKRHQIGAKALLQWREAVKLVQNNVGNRIALDLDHNTHALPIALIADVRMPSMRLSRTSSAIRSIIVALFT